MDALQQTAAKEVNKVLGSSQGQQLVAQRTVNIDFAWRPFLNKLLQNLVQHGFQRLARLMRVQKHLRTLPKHDAFGRMHLSGVGEKPAAVDCILQNGEKAKVFLRLRERERDGKRDEKNIDHVSTRRVST